MIQEKVLIAQASDGNPEAFAGLYRLYAEQIRAVLSRKLKDEHDVEDLLQITFLKAFNGVKKFQGKSAFSTWLTSIALHECSSYWRRDRGRAQYWDCEATVGDIALTFGPAPENSPEEDLFEKELQEHIRHGIDGLPEYLRQVVWLHYMEYHSYPELAQRFQVPVGTVKTWLYRGRSKLRAVLDDVVHA